MSSQLSDSTDIDTASCPAVATPPESPSPEIILTPLGSSSGADELKDCEERLERIVAASISVTGAVLRRIRDGKLYLANYPTFADYLVNRWGWTCNYANRLINAAIVVENIASVPIGTLVLPTAESQVRPLLQLRDTKHQTAAWKRAVTSADGRVPTAEQVQKAVKSLMPGESKGKAHNRPTGTRAERIAAEEGGQSGEQVQPSSGDCPQSPANSLAESASSKSEADIAGGNDGVEEVTGTPVDSSSAQGGFPDSPDMDEADVRLALQRGDKAEVTASVAVSANGAPVEEEISNPGAETLPFEQHSSSPSDVEASGQIAVHDGARHCEEKSGYRPSVTFQLADGSEVAALVDPQSRIVPARLVETTLKLIAPSPNVSIIDGTRRQQAALRVAEGLDRIASVHGDVTLKDGLAELQLALKYWAKTAAIPKSQRQNKRSQ